MPRPMQKYKAYEVNLPEICFIMQKDKLVYAEYGVVKTYANKQQALNKCQELMHEKNIRVDFDSEHPYIIYIPKMFSPACS